MEKITLKNDVKVIGKMVKTFPEGIGQAFDSLSSILPNGFERQYYGLSWFEGDQIIYYATAMTQNSSEAKLFQLDELTIEQGEYLTTKLHNWQTKTDLVKDLFHTLMEDQRTDKTKPCVEWYKSDEEMLCMVKMISDL